MSIAAVRRAVDQSVSGLPPAFWWLWTSTLVNRLGGFVATFLTLYLTIERGYPATFAGLVVALHGLGGVVASLGGGVMADRLGRRPTLLIAQTSTALSVALLGFVQQPAAIAAVAFVVGAAGSASRPAVQAMMADIVPPEDRVRAFSLNYWAINLGFAVSSVAAGFIAEYSYLVGFLGEAAMTLACAIVVFVKLPESRPERPAGAGGPTGAVTGAGKDAGAGLGTVLRDRRFMAVVGLSFLVALVFMQGHMGLPLAMAAEGFSSSDFGLVVAVNGLLIVILQIPVTRFIEHRDPGRLLVLSALVAGYGFGLTAFAGSSLAFYALTVAVWTLAEIVNAPTQTSLVVRFSPVHARGRYQGMYSLSWSAAALVAPLMAGYVVDTWGSAWLWGLCAVIGTVGAVGYALVLRGLPAEEHVLAEERAPADEPLEATAPDPAAPDSASPDSAAPDSASPAARKDLGAIA